jgi:hypothetical protein
MSGRRNVGRGAYWRSVFREHAGSGLSIRRFCRENGISESTFFAWRKKLKKTPPLAKSGRGRAREGSHRGKSPVKQSAGGEHAAPASGRDDPPTENPGMAFVAVRLPTGSESIEVVHPQGYVVRIPGCVNLDCLAGIFQILDRHAAK